MPHTPGAGIPYPAQGVLLRSPFGGGDLPRLRVLVAGHVSLAGLAEPRRADFVTAMDAVATNAVQHGGGQGALLLLRRAGELECRISDRGDGGTGAVDAGLACGGEGALPGGGLWLTRLVTDRLTITPDDPGTTVSFAMRLA